MSTDAPSASKSSIPLKTSLTIPMENLSSSSTAAGAAVHVPAPSTDHAWSFGGGASKKRPAPGSDAGEVSPPKKRHESTLGSSSKSEEVSDASSGDEEEDEGSDALDEEAANDRLVASARTVLLPVVTAATGEEDEINTFQRWARLYRYVPGKLTEATATATTPEPSATSLATKPAFGATSGFLAGAEDAAKPMSAARAASLSAPSSLAPLPGALQANFGAPSSLKPLPGAVQASFGAPSSLKPAAEASGTSPAVIPATFGAPSSLKPVAEASGTSPAVIPATFGAPSSLKPATEASGTPAATFGAPSSLKKPEASGSSGASFGAPSSLKRGSPETTSTTFGAPTSNFRLSKESTESVSTTTSAPALAAVVTGRWEEVGVGNLRVNHSGDAVTPGRLVMRRDGVLKLLLNVAVGPALKLQRVPGDDRSVSFLASIDPMDPSAKPAPLRLKLRRKDDLEELLAAVEMVRVKPA